MLKLANSDVVRTQDSSVCFRSPYNTIKQLYTSSFASIVLHGPFLRLGCRDGGRPPPAEPAAAAALDDAQPIVFLFVLPLLCDLGFLLLLAKLDEDAVREASKAVDSPS